MVGVVRYMMGSACAGWQGAGLAWGRVCLGFWSLGWWRRCLLRGKL